jgi:hypothetical protein
MKEKKDIVENWLPRYTGSKMLFDGAIKLMRGLNSRCAFCDCGAIR